MSSTKIYPFNSLQLRLVNQLVLRSVAGRKTDELAHTCGCSPSEVAFELLKLRELGYVSTVKNEGSDYVTWYSSPGLVDALRRYTISKLQQCTEDNTPIKTPTYRVFGPEASRYMPKTYATESAALKEATLRAKNAPGQSVQVYVLHKTLIQKPEQVIPGELIVE